jgi:hypothetical protein
MLDLAAIWNAYIDALNVHIFAPLVAAANLGAVIPEPRCG